MSSGILTTQCEAQGFRKFMFSFDRPDVMTKYTVNILAPATNFPVLLSNGNQVASSVNNDGTHSARWVSAQKCVVVCVRLYE